jgi:Spy/CpxP family protein refolding chaperone
MSRTLRLYAAAISLTAALISGARAQTQPSQPSQDNSQTNQQAQPGNQDQQGPHRRGPRARRAARRHGMEELAQKLNLTDDQKKQFQQIRQNTMQQAKSIRGDSSLSQDQKQEKMLALRKQSHQEMFKVLTPEQQAQLKQMREEHKQKMQQQKKGETDKSSSSGGGDDDPFAGMVSDDDDGGARA